MRSNNEWWLVGVIMASALRVANLLVVICLMNSQCQGTTHWVVTEEGLITQQLDSTFNMQEPYNLIALISQEKRSTEVNNLENDLRVQKADIEANEDKDTDLEQRFLETDEDCVAAGRPLSEFELYISTALSLEQKGINPLDHMKMKIGEVKKFRQPNCSRVLELPYSIHAFDHIKSVQECHNISSFPEPELMYLLPSVGSLENAGHMIYKAMSKNKTSWILFNLAAYYWRVKGRPEQVIECSRRALHFSPRLHKNVALMNMANVMHRGHLSADAAVVAEAALEGDQEMDIVYFTLGNIYAALGECNKSSTCFGHTARINPALGAAEKRQHAVKCHQKLESALEAQHSSLQRTLGELKDYQTKQEYFLELQKKMWSFQRKAEDQFEANLSYQKHRFLQEMGENPHCEVSQLGSGTQFLMCRRDGIPESDVYGLPIDEEREIEVVDESRFQNNCVIFPNGEQNCLNLSTTGPPGQRYLNYRVPDKPVSGLPLPKRVDPPTHDECTKWSNDKTTWKEYSQRILPLSNKESLNSLMDVMISSQTSDVDVPTCTSMIPLFEGNTGVDFVEGIALRKTLPKIDPPLILVQMYTEFTEFHGMSEKEFKLRVAFGIGSTREYRDKWLLLNAASVYFRLQGDSTNAIECLRRALFHAPVEHADVPLVNLGQIMMDHDLGDDAVQILRMALVPSGLKPTTRFLLACAYASRGRYRQAKQEGSLAYRLDPGLTGAEEVFAGVKCHKEDDVDENQDLSPETRTEIRRWEFERRAIYQTSRTQSGGDHDRSNPVASHNLSGAGANANSAAASIQRPPGINPSIGCQEGRQPDSIPSSFFEKNANGEVKSYPATKKVTTKAPVAGTVPSSAWGPQVPAVPAPDVDVHELLSTTTSPWPTPEECATFKRLNLKAFYSTWVSVSAKDMRLEDYVDFTTSLSREDLLLQPYCPPDLPTSMHTLDHLPAMGMRRDLQYDAEQGLKEVLQSLNGGQMSVDEVGARITKALKEDPESWVATNMAALYWRVEGKSENALDCLRHALHYSPPNLKDLALVSIANIFHRVRMLDDGIVVAKMAVDISPELVINHFTLGNIYSSKGQWDKAIEYYESTLSLQPEFQPAIERLHTIQCNVLQLTANKNPPPKN